MQTTMRPSNRPATRPPRPVDGSGSFRKFLTTLNGICGGAIWGGGNAAQAGALDKVAGANLLSCDDSLLCLPSSFAFLATTDLPVGVEAWAASAPIAAPHPITNQHGCRLPRVCRRACLKTKREMLARTAPSTIASVGARACRRWRARGRGRPLRPQRSHEAANSDGRHEPHDRGQHIRAAQAQR